MSRKNYVDDYAISLDIGNASVGWSAFTPNYRLVRAKGHELIGVRLFDPADTAESRRMARTARRRYSRRRWRLRLLDALFDQALSEIDPSFLARRKYSWVHPDDENNADCWYGSVLFDSNEQDKRFYEKYPTIYHLRKALMEDDSQHDIREIYLAIHHMVKYRGNFLVEGTLESSNAFKEDELLKLLGRITRYEMSEGEQNSDIEQDDENKLVAPANGQLADALCATRGSRSMRVDNALEALSAVNDLSREQRAIVKAIFAGLEGNKLDLAKIFVSKEFSSENKKILGIYFNKSDYEEKCVQIVDSGLLDDEEREFLDRMQGQYNAIALKQLLGRSTSVSDSKCASYDAHRANWNLIKLQLRTKENEKDINENYGILVGWKIDSGQRKSVRGESAYENMRKKANVFFKKMIETSDLSETDKNRLIHDIEEDKLFPIQRDSDNGVIPHQLHQNELKQIIKKQGKYYPFLLDAFEKDGKQINKIEGLLAFRVPYFVGPLVVPEDLQKSDNSENHWMVRKKKGEITPWNFDEMVDKDASGRKFIERLVGTDSYLLGEPTLPKNSLLYQEYEVLNELNNVRLSVRTGNHWNDKRRMRLGREEKTLLCQRLFMKGQTVTKRTAENLLRKEYGRTYELSGLSDESKFTSSLSTYGKMCRIFGEKYVNEHRDLMEKIVELQTVFEDKETLLHQLRQLEGISEADCALLVNTHYTGWGRLSRKLLTTKAGECKISDDFAPRKHSIIEIMRAEDRNLMEIITDKQLGFSDWIEQENLGAENGSSLMEVVDDLRVSPKVKRGIIQSIRLIDDISKAVGKRPSRIFLELADDIQPSGRTISRKSRLQDLYRNANLGKEFKGIADELNACSDKDLQDDRLFLYYTQLGKDMYTGEELDLDRLSSAYDIDHIIPQAVTQNDSIDNRVLVARAENARKTDSFTYMPQIADRMRNFWQILLDNGLISRVKFERLTRQNEFSEREKERFVQRSLVETRQIMKNVATLMRQRYGNSAAVIGLNAELTKEMHRYLGFSHKNRDINDYHHAQDALCVGIAGQFAANRGFFADGEVSDGAQNSYNQYLRDYLRGYREKLSAEDRKQGRAFGFIVGSMRSQDEQKRVNPRTGEVVWSEEDKDYLRKVMNYRKMLVTQKVGDDFGALYDETRYAATDPKGIKGIPFDGAKQDTSLYGGFSSAKPAYAVLIESKGKTRLVNVTMQEYSLLGDRPSDDELRKVLAKKKSEYAKANILLRHVPKMQLIRYGGGLMVIKSAGELNNAQQLWLPYEEYCYFDDLSQGKGSLEKDDLKKLLDSILGSVQCLYPWHRFTEEELADLHVAFDKLPEDEKKNVITGIVSALHADAKTANLSIVGMTGSWRRMNNKSGYTFSDEDEFIFQSPSGLFEKRVTVGELKRKAKKEVNSKYRTNEKRLPTLSGASQP